MSEVSTEPAGDLVDRVAIALWVHEANAWHGPNVVKYRNADTWQTLLLENERAIYRANARAAIAAILRAAGSSLANYTMPGTRAAILAAVQAVRDDECARVAEWLRGCLAEHEANANRKGQITERRHHIAACTNIIAAIERGEHTAYRAATKGEE